MRDEAYTLCSLAVDLASRNSSMIRKGYTRCLRIDSSLEKVANQKTSFRRTAITHIYPERVLEIVPKLPEPTMAVRLHRRDCYPNVRFGLRSLDGSGN